MPPCARYVLEASSTSFWIRRTSAPAAAASSAAPAPAAPPPTTSTGHLRTGRCSATKGSRYLEPAGLRNSNGEASWHAIQRAYQGGDRHQMAFLRHRQRIVRRKNRKTPEQTVAISRTYPYLTKPEPRTGSPTMTAQTSLEARPSDITNRGTTNQGTTIQGTTIQGTTIQAVRSRTNDDQNRLGSPRWKPGTQPTNTRTSSRDSVARKQPSRQNLSPSPAGSEPVHRPMDSGFPTVEKPPESHRRTRFRSGDFSLPGDPSLPASVHVEAPASPSSSNKHHRQATLSRAGHSQASHSQASLGQATLRQATLYDGLPASNKSRRQDNRKQGHRKQGHRRQVLREQAIHLDALSLAGLAPKRRAAVAQGITAQEFTAQDLEGQEVGILEVNGPINREILTGIALALVVLSFLFVASMAS